VPRALSPAVFGRAVRPLAAICGTKNYLLAAPRSPHILPLMLRAHAASAPGDPTRRATTSPYAPAGRSGGVVKQVEEASFVDLIACERDCRSCSYAAALDCDGNCGVCAHNAYCPCVNPVVARSKTALRLIELRPILLQDVRGRI